MARRFSVGFLVTLALVVLSAVFLGLTRTWWLDKIGRYLVLNEPPCHSDAIVAVSGEDFRRQWAITLYKQGYSRLLIFNLSDSTYFFGRAVDTRKAAIEMAAAQGIPSDSVVLNTDVSSTWEDALATRKTVERLGLGSILIVSSPFNMRRVALTYRRIFSNLPVRITFCSVPAEMEKISLDRWWTKERELQLVNNEYLKIIFYFCKYFI
jgi:uncharacterized SAM-binding protein YcdF (DUF218 family)